MSNFHKRLASNDGVEGNLEAISDFRSVVRRALDHLALRSGRSGRAEEPTTRPADKTASASLSNTNTCHKSMERAPVRFAPLRAQRARRFLIGTCPKSRRSATWPSLSRGVISGSEVRSSRFIFVLESVAMIYALSVFSLGYLASGPAPAPVRMPEPRMAVVRRAAFEGAARYCHRAMKSTVSIPHGLLE